MNNKSIIWILIILAAGLVIFGGIYLIRQNQGPVHLFFETTSTTQGLDQNQEEVSGTTTTVTDVNSTTTQTQQPISGQSQSKIITDDFSINLPDGWRQANAPAGTTAMAVKFNEHISDPAAKKINFNSYFAVVYDTIGEKSLQEYVDFTKQSLQQVISLVVFVSEANLSINGQQAHKIEMEMTQQGADFKVLLVIVKGQGNDVWTISFNTTKSNWGEYQNVFYNTANSFIVKK